MIFYLGKKKKKKKKRKKKKKKEEEEEEEEEEERTLQKLNYMSDGAAAGGSAGVRDPFNRAPSLTPCL